MLEVAVDALGLPLNAAQAFCHGLHQLQLGPRRGQLRDGLLQVRVGHRAGGKASLGRITKRGDDDLRTLLIQGAKSAVMNAGKRSDRISQWLLQLKQRVGWHKAVVAECTAADRSTTESSARRAPKMPITGQTGGRRTR